MSLSVVGISPKKYKFYKAHSHGDYEVIVNTEGSGIITIGEREYRFSPGDIHIIPRNTPHIKVSEEGFRDIYFRTDSLNPAATAEIRKGKLAFTDDSRGSFGSVLELMLRRFCLNLKNDLVLESMYELILRMLDDFCGKELMDPAVEYIINRMTLEFNEPDFSVSDILLQTGYSKDYIRRRFIAETGITPVEYLTSMRISYAKKLLSDQPQNRLSLSAIGAMCGYYDSRYFARIFKSSVGCSPGEYLASKAKKV